MRPVQSLFLSLAVLLGVVTPAYSAVITYSYTAEIFSLNGPNISGQVSIGDTVSGTFTLDPSTPDIEALPYQGAFPSGSPTFSMAINGHQWHQYQPGTVVVNDAPSPCCGPSDFIRIQEYLTGDALGSANPITARFEFNSSLIAAAISSEAFPGIGTLNAFDSAVLYGFFLDPNDTFGRGEQFRARLTSLQEVGVSEPPMLLLFGAAFFALIGAQRNRGLLLRG